MIGINYHTGAYCAYDNNQNNADIYGYLYNWHAAHDNRQIAPEGWHVPTDQDWKELEMSLGMSRMKQMKSDIEVANKEICLKKVKMNIGSLRAVQETIKVVFRPFLQVIVMSSAGNLMILEATLFFGQLTNTTAVKHGPDT